MMQFWMPLILAGFGGFMLCASVQHTMTAIKTSPFGFNHALFSVWAFSVSALALSNCVLYVDMSMDAYLILTRFQSSLAVFISMMILVFAVSYLDVGRKWWVYSLIAVHLFLFVFSAASHTGGLSKDFSQLARPESGLMAGRLISVSPVFGWPMYLFDALLLVDFTVAFYWGCRKYFLDGRSHHIAVYIAALGFYFCCVVAESILFSLTGELSNVSLLGVGSMVFFMGGTLSSVEHEKHILQLNTVLEDKVSERTVDLEKALATLSDEMHAKEAIQAQLLQAQKMESIGQLAGGFAHDFNNILTSIRGYGELALSEADPSDDLHVYASQIVNSADKATYLTSQLLGFARKQRRDLKLYHVDALAEKYLREHPCALGAGIHVGLAASDNLEPVLLDAHHFEQIFSHLLANACDAMPFGGTVSLLVEAVDVSGKEDLPKGLLPGKYIRLTVIDSGCGMDASTHSRIFEPFFTTRPSERSGLGLAVCYGLVKQNRGYIFSESDPGRGSRFDVYFRCEVTEGSAIA